jgi:uncharacterized protein
MFLLDINVWLAMAFEAHVHHISAKTWFDDLEDNSCCFCRYTQSGFLRLATNPTVFGKEALRLSDAWSIFDGLMEDPRIQFSQEPLGLEHLWRKMTLSKKHSPKVWNDAYLAAFAIAGGIQLVTFDSGFSRFKNLDCEILGRKR